MTWRRFRAARSAPPAVPREVTWGDATLGLLTAGGGAGRRASEDCVNKGRQHRTLGDYQQRANGQQGQDDGQQPPLFAYAHKCPELTRDVRFSHVGPSRVGMRDSSAAKSGLGIPRSALQAGASRDYELLPESNR